MENLKPCPFCGGEAYCNNAGFELCGVSKWATECLGCGTVSGFFDTREEAIEAWERRANELDQR